MALAEYISLNKYHFYLTYTSEVNSPVIAVTVTVSFTTLLPAMLAIDLTVGISCGFLRLLQGSRVSRTGFLLLTQRLFMFIVLVM